TIPSPPSSTLFPYTTLFRSVFQQKVASVKDATGAPMFPITNLDDLSAQVGENVDGRTGGAVSLAVGMAQIFSAIPGMRSLMSYRSEEHTSELQSLTNLVCRL